MAQTEQGACSAKALLQFRCKAQVDLVREEIGVLNQVCAEVLQNVGRLLRTQSRMGMRGRSGMRNA